MTTLNLRVYAGSTEAGNLGKHVSSVVGSLIGNLPFVVIPRPVYSRHGDMIHITADFTLLESGGRSSRGIMRGRA